MKTSDLHVKAKVMSSACFDWLAAILITPLFTVISISSPVSVLSRGILSDEFRDIGSSPLSRQWCSAFIDALACFF